MYPIIIIIDVEPDGFFIDPTDPQPWVGFESAVDFFDRWRGRFADATGKTVNFTWGIRADEQIKRTYGRRDWAHMKYREVFQLLRQEGDELGIHIHAYRYNPGDGGWVEDYQDQSWINENIQMAVEVHRRHFGNTPNVFSMGVDWINHETVFFAEQQGIKVDCTIVAEQGSVAFPGLGTYQGQRADLSSVQQRLYRPDKSDFRIQNSSDTGEIYCLPLSHTERDGLKKRLKRSARQMLGKREQPPQQCKLFADCDCQELKRQLKRLTSHNGPGYLTLCLATRKFTKETSTQAIERNFEHLVSAGVAKHLQFVTPMQLLPC